MIDGLPLADLGATALLAVGVLMILAGRLVPRGVLTAALEEVRVDRDHWRRAAEERSAQLSQLLAATDTSTRAIEALTEVAGVARPEAEE